MDFNIFFSQDFAEKVVNNSITESQKGQIKEIYAKVKRLEMAETCHNCFSDAYFLLFNLYKSDKKRFNALYSCEYRMPAGAVISIFGETDTIMTAANITNELAEYHLRRNNDVLKDFSLFPQDAKENIPRVRIETNIRFFSVFFI